MTRVLVAPLLETYTGGAREVDAAGETLGALLQDLDARYPGLRFRIVDEQERIRPHIKLFVGQELARSLETPVGPADQVMIVGALSGG